MSERVKCDQWTQFSRKTVPCTRSMDGETVITAVCRSARNSQKTGLDWSQMTTISAIWHRLTWRHSYYIMLGCWHSNSTCRLSVMSVHPTERVELIHSIFHYVVAWLGCEENIAKIFLFFPEVVLYKRVAKDRNFLLISCFVLDTIHDSYNRRQIGTCMRNIEWSCFQWLWVTTSVIDESLHHHWSARVMLLSFWWVCFGHPIVNSYLRYQSSTG